MDRSARPACQKGRGQGRRNWCIVATLGVVILAAGATAASFGRRRTEAPACRPGARLPGESPILAVHHVPSLTAERYDAVVRGLTNGRGRLESLSDGGIQGLLFHVAGQGADGFWVVDVWESQEAIDRFSQRVRPIAQAAGISEPMKTYAVHNVLAC